MKTTITRVLEDGRVTSSGPRRLAMRIYIEDGAITKVVLGTINNQDEESWVLGVSPTVFKWADAQLEQARELLENVLADPKGGA